MCVSMIKDIMKFSSFYSGLHFVIISRKIHSILGILKVHFVLDVYVSVFRVDALHISLQLCINEL